MRTAQEKPTSSSVHKHSSPDARLLELERKFPVPVEQLFEAFTTSESLKQWWWPQGMYADQVEIDFREGGRYLINMKGYESSSGGMTGHFEEIIQNERIVMTDQFADRKGDAISAKEANMPGVWPEMAYITLEFESLDSQTSQLKLFQQGIPNEYHGDCIQGWAESFDKLQKYLGSPRH
nr:SRPBCC domain-containing protein [Bdellovibrio sp. CKG001]